MKSKFPSTFSMSTSSLTHTRNLHFWLRILLSIPTPEDGDLLFESRAITSGQVQGTGPDMLLHRPDRTPKEAAIVKLWLEVKSHRYSRAISPIVHQFFAAHLHGRDPDQPLIDQNLWRLGAVLDVYEQRLGATNYLAGHSYTLADLHHLPYTFHFRKTPWAALVYGRPRVRVWWDDISSRAAFLKVAHDMTTSARDYE
ncbi:glutathione S-transferase F13-like [Momordica charantia]|uniref:glutathione transferase n=1 Tax=Momordica charantia TaxID=3673 RepID=A0A6J1DL28_MOMCH|nr:glutathione S-transferase F13-like [Momordica charantia]